MRLITKTIKHTNDIKNIEVELTQEQMDKIEKELRDLEVNKDWKLEILVELTNIDKAGLKKVLEILQKHIPIKYKIRGVYSRWLPRDQETYKDCVNMKEWFEKNKRYIK